MKAFDYVVQNTLSNLEHLGENKIQFSIPINNKNREYNGFNFFSLNAIKSARKYKSDIYMTFREIQKHKGKVKKGSNTLPVVFWNFMEKKKVGVDGEEKKDKIFYMKYYKVFNLDDTDLDPQKIESNIKYYNANDIIKKWDISKTGDLREDITEVVKKARSAMGFDNYEDFREDVFLNFAIAMVLAKTKHKSHIDMTVSNVKDMLKSDRYKFMYAISRAKKVANKIFEEDK